MSRARAATRVIGCALLFGLACIAQPAAATEPRLTWSAPPECPSADELREHILELMGGAVESNLAAVARVTRHADRYRAHVIFRGPGGFGERELENARCDLLQNGVAVLIALSIPSRQSTDSDAASRALRASVQGRVVSGRCR